MKVTLELTLDTPADDAKLVYPRVAGALIDYAAAVVRNNQAMLQLKGKDAQAPRFEGAPPVGLGTGGRITTAHGVTVREARIEHDPVDPDTDRVASA